MVIEMMFRVAVIMVRFMDRKTEPGQGCCCRQNTNFPVLWRRYVTAADNFRNRHTISCNGNNCEPL
jgi:hypothetical protein